MLSIQNLVWSGEVESPLWAPNMPLPLTQQPLQGQEPPQFVRTNDLQHLRASQRASGEQGGSATTKQYSTAPKGWVAPTQQLVPRSRIFYHGGFSAKAGLPCKRE